MSADLYFAESDPLAEVLDAEDLDALAEEWLRAINGPDAELARDTRTSRPRLPRPTR
jgi:hypothetical protein